MTSRTDFASVEAAAGTTVEAADGTTVESVAVESVAVGSVAVGSVAVGSVAVGSVAVGSVAVGAVAVGSVAVGAVAVGSVAVGSVAVQSAGRSGCPVQPVAEEGATHPASNLGIATVDDLGAQIVALSGRIAAATCRWLRLVAEFDLRGGFERFGLTSTAAWLSHACGLARRTSMEHVRVARALVANPQLETEMSSGRLSFSQVRAISRVNPARNDPVVLDLIGVAQHGTTRQLESVVRGLRAAAVADADAGTDAEAHAEAHTDEASRRCPSGDVRSCAGAAAAAGSVSDQAAAEDETPDAASCSASSPVTRAVTVRERADSYWDDDGAWRYHARLSAERGALIDGALDAIVSAEGISRQDALVRMAELALTVLADRGIAARSRRGDERAAIIVHIDAERVIPEADEPQTMQEPPTSAGSPSDPGAQATPAGWPYGRLADGPGLSAGVIRRLACEGRVRTIVKKRERGGDDVILAVGRSHRLVNRRQFTALLLRDHGRCAFPGCDSRRALQAHHVRHWFDGGRTDMSNLVLLCPRHHRSHHEGGFAIRCGKNPASQRFAFLRTDGQPITAEPLIVATDMTIEDEHAAVTADAARSRWAGDRLDLGYAVSCLASRRSSPSAAGQQRDHSQTREQSQAHDQSQPT